MENIFLSLLNMSITASWIALAVIVLRLILKKAPKWIMGVLWGFVALRLICPFSFESVFSLIPSTETVPQEILTSNNPTINSGLGFVNQAINPVISGSLSPNASESVNPMQLVVFIASIIWIAGIIAMISYTLISYLRIHKKVCEAVNTDGGYWICDRISTPFILGVFRPKIYLPSAMDEASHSYVLAHEKAHLKRKDYLWKPIGFLLLTIYWFNPILWIVYILLCRDIELACDEKVIKQMGIGIKKPYSDALINCSVPRRMIAVCPLAFGEVAVKERVKSVLNYKKPAFWIIIVAVVACVVAAVCLLTSPISTKIDDDLTVFLDNTIVNQNSGDKTGDNFITEDYKILGTKKSGTETTVYLWVLYQEWTFDGELKEDSGSHIPTVITVNKKGNTDGDSYELVEYWIPRDGSYYADDIKAKFPITLWSKALDPGWCIEEQQANCLKNAQEYYGISTSTVGGVDGPTDVITQSTSTFDATVLEINGKSIFVQPVEGSNELKSADKISFSLDKLDSGDLPEIKVGDKIRITYDGTIAESYPAQLFNIYAVYGIDDSGEIIYLYGFPSENSQRYTFNSSVESVVKPNIVLSNGGNRFQFTYSALSSYIAVGNYELTDNKLTLKTDDGNNTYVFNVKGNTFVFDASKSSEIPKYAYSSGAKAECPVPDGAIFE